MNVHHGDDKMALTPSLMYGAALSFFDNFSCLDEQG